MARQSVVNQSSRERKVYPLDFTPSLLEGVTLDPDEADITYTGENADDNPPVISYVIDTADNIIYVGISNLEVTTKPHKVSCIAITSNDDLRPEIELIINTKT